jgi:hypothetical protein
MAKGDKVAGKSELARDTNELARTWNGGEQVRVTYILLSAEGWINQDMERN